ncbi:DUF418 domain-containing protein [Glycomyces sp. L485]|uniref:DUF418 domain-containing protein n=1 Tax=Glycomyces sp. L485 TaxID=2909235 RepID=UPI001F4B2724|nr:DUF418 domain-containing protein [Glycomyces sp. L485]MCH7229654.1 DUF418 domain-containing protein [Glycomyces sp. L485]
MHTATTTDAPASPGEAASKRLPLLDVLRGVAILGTLGTNVWIFTAPHGEAGPLLGWAATDATVLGAAFEFLANGKFIAMLTMLFGVGLAIQHRSAAKRGRRWPGRYHWRTLFLFVEGAVHFTLVFAWDVLMGYAVTAIAVAWMLTRSRTFRRAAMWTSLTLHLALMGLITNAMFTGPGIDPQREPSVEALYASGSWIEQVQFRLDNALAFRIEPIVAFPLMTFLFLLGVELFRAGAFGADERARSVRSRLLRWGLGVGAPVTIALMAGPEELFFLERYVAAPVLALGYIGLTGWLVDRFRPGPLMAGLSSLGRTALSGYILQNLLASAVCYGWGLGLAARFGNSAWFGAALWLAISAVLVVGARLWLRRFATGPAEMLQKTLIR